MAQLTNTNSVIEQYLICISAVHSETIVCEEQFLGKEINSGEHNYP